jgi:hypothetical protein
MLAAWALIFAAFVYEPGWIRDSLRFMTHSIESLADQVPEPWGARLEIMLRELGGMIWIQIATAIVLLRLIIGCHSISGDCAENAGLVSDTAWRVR